jgi:putative membrane protein
MSGESGTGVAGSGATDMSGLSDAQVAAIVQVINEGEIQQAQLAQSKAKSAGVKRFAQHMLAAHRDMENKDKKLLVRIQVVPSESAVGNQLKTEGQNQLSTLQGMTGPDFDRDYIEVQIRGHNQALELIDRMVPAVKSAELKTELQNARPVVEQHLLEAERIQQDMQKASNRQSGVKQAQ